MHELTALKFHVALPFRDVSLDAQYRATCPGLLVKYSPAVGTEAAIAMKRASARSPGSSEMLKATAVPGWA
jgi:hypothetical protein